MELLINSTSSIRADLQQTPLENGDLTLYCDGSSMRPNDKTILSGYAVVTDDRKCLESFKLPVRSAQAAEIIALTQACLLAKNKSVTIFADSKYAFSTAHDFSMIWSNRGFDDCRKTYTTCQVDKRVTGCNDAASTDCHSKMCRT